MKPASKPYHQTKSLFFIIANYVDKEVKIKIFIKKICAAL